LSSVKSDMRALDAPTNTASGTSRSTVTSSARGRRCRSVQWCVAFCLPFASAALPVAADGAGVGVTGGSPVAGVAAELAAAAAVACFAAASASALARASATGGAGKGGAAFGASAGWGTTSTGRSVRGASVRSPCSRRAASAR